MATFRFVEQPRNARSNEPLTYSMVDTTDTAKTIGTLKRQKNKWRLQWAGLGVDFSTKHEMRRHFRAMGHGIEGIA